MEIMLQGSEGNHVPITIFVIATKSYVLYARTLIESIDAYMTQTMRVQVILLTDQAEDNVLSGMELSGAELKICKIESYGWPEAALLRFDLILRFWNQVTGDIVMYLDADTEVVAPISAKDLLGAIQPSRQDQIVFVQHPGYFNRSTLFRLAIRTPLGPWERRKKSNAFVPISKRKIYVCSGVFWGTRTSFQKLCNDLKKNVQDDLNRGLIAKWHDESHVNHWFNQHSANTVTPEWAYASGYRNLKQLMPRIVVIHKPTNFERVGSNI